MATPEDARRANRSLILGILHRSGARSRADLAKRTGLTRASASAVVRDLLDDGLVEELGPDPAGGVGKPATLVAVDADGRHAVCLDLSEPAQFVGAIVDLAGHVLERRVYPRRGKTGRAALALVVKACRDLVAAVDRPLLGVGVASPGVVDRHGVVITAAHLRWNRLALADELSRRLDLPVVVVNDANAAALAELTFGESPVSDLVCVRVDEGVGAGLVLQGRLHTGASNAAGEIGHVVVEPDGARCACGKRGCLETEVSEPLLRRRLAAAADDADSAAILAAAGAHLGAVLATVLSALDVHDVVVSGSDAATTERFRHGVGAAIAERTTPGIGDRLVVRTSTFGSDDVLVGAAARLLDHELGVRT